MENNFYVGVVHYGKRPFKQEYSERLVLYSDDNVKYLDLMGNIWYTTDCSNRDYVDSSSLIPTDVSQYREDYIYLLSKCRENKLMRKKKLFDKFNIS